MLAIAGVMIGNKRFMFQRSTFLFHDGLAWLSQIMMFVVLGLLVNPESLLDVWLEGLVIAAVLILVARPLAVAPVLKLFGFNRNEIGLVSWVGLRGSVPIIQAIFPLLFGLPGAELIFEVVFFVVLISATIQGSTLPWMARRLGLTEAPPLASAATLEITSLGDVDAEIVEYTLSENSKPEGLLLSQVALPDNTIVAMISRDSTVIPPRGSTRLMAGDHLFVVLRPELRAFVDCVFAQAPDVGVNELLQTPLNLKGSARVEDIRRAYGLTLSEDGTQTLEQLAKAVLGNGCDPGDRFSVGGIRLRIVERVAGRITTISVSAESDITA